MKRIFLIVLDSFGAGALPDAAKFGDAGSHTLRSISRDPGFSAENMRALGLGNIDGLDFLGPVSQPRGAYARMSERSMGKDTTTGHWEIAGVVSPDPLPTYPQGFPREVLAAFAAATGRGILCNLPYSGTDVIRDYGAEQLETGKWIVYTSADSVFQIAAHEERIPLEELYAACETARGILRGKHGVGRVIARPYIGTPETGFTRTTNRHDFSLQPPKETLLDAVKAAGLDSIAVGKISDIFAGRGVTEKIPTKGNTDGLAKTLALAERDFSGLCFVNLVDFDMLYGHRNDISGYAKAAAEFDRWLPGFLSKMGPDDLVMITADHGCDPGYPTTDHTREYAPLLIAGARVKPINLGTRSSFSDIAATISELLNAKLDTPGKSFAGEIVRDSMTPEALIALAIDAMKKAYAPYSGYFVGAALLCGDGTVYQGCNIENAAFGPTVCAERTAIFKAVYDGKRDFSAIAVVGGKDGLMEGVFPPCGVCRQVMAEFCGPDFRIYLADSSGKIQTHTLSELLPLSFSLEK